MTLAKLMGGLKRYLFQFSPFHNIKESLKLLVLFVFPLSGMPHVEGLCVACWELREVRGSQEGIFASQTCSRTLGFSALD